MEEETITVVLGVFNKPNKYNQIYHISEDRLKEIMDKKINTFFGEMSTPDFPKEQNAHIERAQQVDVSNNNGILKSYNIVKDKQVIKDAGKVLTLYADIVPSEKLKKYLSSGTTAYFGIRTLGVRRGNMSDHPQYTHFGCMFLSFDIVSENPRPNFTSNTMMAVC